MPANNQNKNEGRTDAFEVKDSLTVLLIIFSIAVLFSILLCYYPGKAFLKENFWPLFALPATLAAGCLFKILTRKIILRVDTAGLHFFRSGIFVPWKKLRSANLKEEDDGDGQVATNLNVRYTESLQGQLVEINFPIMGSMNKTASEIINAVHHFHERFSAPI